MKFQFIYPGGTWATGMQHMSSDPFAPPLGVLYLSSCLEKAGHKASVIDYWAEKFDKKRLTSKLKNADAVGVTITGFNLKESLDICYLIKEIDLDIPLVIGGPHVTIYPEKSLKESHADIAVEGEGEPGIVKLADAIIGKTRINAVEGVHYKKNGEFKKGKDPGLVKDLNTLIFTWPVMGNFLSFFICTAIRCTPFVIIINIGDKNSCIDHPRSCIRPEVRDIPFRHRRIGKFDITKNIMQYKFFHAMFFYF